GTTYASRYAEVTQMTALMSASREAMMSGIATETIVESTRIMKKPKHSAHSARQGFVTAFDWLLTGSSLSSSPSRSIRTCARRGSRPPVPEFPASGARVPAEPDVSVHAAGRTIGGNLKQWHHGVPNQRAAHRLPLVSRHHRRRPGRALCRTLSVARRNGPGQGLHRPRCRSRARWGLARTLGFPDAGQNQ